MPALRGGEGGGHKGEGRGGKEGGIGLKRQREETETAVNARGFGEVGDSEACELAVNPVRAGASSQRAPFSRGRGRKKKKGLHTEPWKRRGMGQLCRRSPAPRPADKGRSEEAGESRASGRRRENGNRFPVHATFSFRFAVLRVRCQRTHAQVTVFPPQSIR